MSKYHTFMNKTSIQGYCFLIYNRLSHYDPEVNPLKIELTVAITADEILRTEL